MTEAAGLSAERTRLAWRRTTLALTGVALLAARVALRDITFLRVVLLVLVVAGWIGGLALAHRRIRALADGIRRPVGRSPAALAMLIILYATLGALLIALAP